MEKVGQLSDRRMLVLITPEEAAKIGELIHDLNNAFLPVTVENGYASEPVRKMMKQHQATRREPNTKEPFAPAKKPYPSKTGKPRDKFCVDCGEKFHDDSLRNKRSRCGENNTCAKKETVNP